MRPNLNWKWVCSRLRLQFRNKIIIIFIEIRCDGPAHALRSIYQWAIHVHAFDSFSSKEGNSNMENGAKPWPQSECRQQTEFDLRKKCVNSDANSINSNYFFLSHSHMMQGQLEYTAVERGMRHDGNNKNSIEFFFALLSSSIRWFVFIKCSSKICFAIARSHPFVYAFQWQGPVITITIHGKYNKRKWWQNVANKKKTKRSTEQARWSDKKANSILNAENGREGKVTRHVRANAWTWILSREEVLNPWCAMEWSCKWSSNVCASCLSGRRQRKYSCSVYRGCWVIGALAGLCACVLCIVLNFKLSPWHHRIHEARMESVKSGRDEGKTPSGKCI